MNLEPKSAVEIDEQIWRKVKIDLTKRRLHANLLSNFAFKLTKLNFPSYLLGNFESRFCV